MIIIHFRWTRFGPTKALLKQQFIAFLIVSQLSSILLCSGSRISILADGEAQLIFVLDTSSLIHLQKDDVFRGVFTDLLLNERMRLLDDQNILITVTFLIPLRVVFELDSMKKDAAAGEPNARTVWWTQKAWCIRKDQLRSTNLLPVTQFPGLTTWTYFSKYDCLDFLNTICSSHWKPGILQLNYSRLDFWQERHWSISLSSASGSVLWFCRVEAILKR